MMPNIWEYTDYRKYLRDFYRETKSQGKAFSYQALATRAGIGSRGFWNNVFNGRRTLSRSHVFALIRALKLGRPEALYFENLVAFNQAATLEARSQFYERLLSVQSCNKETWAPHLLRKEQFEFYSKIHHSVVRSLIDLHGFNGDYASMARSVHPHITPGKAKKSVELLERLGLIKKQRDGAYRVTNKSISTPPEVAKVAVVDFHKQAGELALLALQSSPKVKRNMTGMTLGISVLAYDRICREIEAFRRKILQIAESDERADTVYQLNFQLFQVSKTKQKELK